MHADGETFTMAPLLMTRRSLSTQHQALPVHVRARVGSQGDLGLEVAGQVGGVAAPVFDSASAVEPPANDCAQMVEDPCIQWIRRKRRLWLWR